MSFHPKQAKRPIQIRVIEGEGERRITYERFDFPDGQPHIKLSEVLDGRDVVIVAAITSPDDLFELLMLKDILDAGLNRVMLHITYLMGARMDRRIDFLQPHTLAVVCDALRNAEFDMIEILDPHSNYARDFIKSPRTPVRTIYPGEQVREVLKNYYPYMTRIVIPDTGAEERVLHTTEGTDFTNYIRCTKERDPATGKLSHFTIINPADVNGMLCLIIDDICDGGRTFEGIAMLLRDAGATGVDLFVTHGIFSRGGRLAGIDGVYTTDSYPGRRDDVITLPLDTTKKPTE